MGFMDFFKRKKDPPVVFTGEYLETELVKGMLAEEGFHPYKWSDLPRPYLGSVGMGRVLVPPEELEEARDFLRRTREAAERAASEEADGPEGVAPGEAADRPRDPLKGKGGRVS